VSDNGVSQHFISLHFPPLGTRSPLPIWVENFRSTPPWVQSPSVFFLAQCYVSGLSIPHRLLTFAVHDTSPYARDCPIGRNSILPFFFQSPFSGSFMVFLRAVFCTAYAVAGKSSKSGLFLTTSRHVFSSSSPYHDPFRNTVGNDFPLLFVVLFSEECR